MSKVTIRLDTLKTVSKAMPKTDPRNVLIGVFVEVTPDGKTILTATNGKIMATIPKIQRANEGLDAEFIIPAETVLAMLKRATKRIEYATIDLGEGRIGFRDGKPDMLFQPVDGKYPNYRAVVPHHNRQSGKLASLTLSAEVLAQLTQLAKCANTNGYVTLFMEMKYGQVQDRPVVVVDPYSEQEIGLIMPVRSRGRELEIAVWPKRKTADELAVDAPLEPQTATV